MLARVYTAAINDRVAGPALELLRRVCQPDSSSLPHITIRYESDSQTAHDEKLYQDYSFIPSLSLEEPGTFDAIPIASSASTIFLRCDADELEWLAYKPDFPDSFFHATVYDGPPSEFAAAVFSVLQSFQWGLQVDMSESRVIRKRRRPVSANSAASKPSSTLSNGAQNLLERLGGSAALLFERSTVRHDDQLLRISTNICSYLHEQLVPRAAATTGTARPVQRLPDPARQNNFWEAGDLAPALANSRLSIAQRKSGIVTTPPEVAIEILQKCGTYVDAQDDVHFGDPAIGSGIFFAAAVQRFQSRLKDGVGVELDGARAALTSRRWRARNLGVYVGDFVSTALDNASGTVLQNLMRNQANPNLIVANPPYVKNQGIEPGSKEIWVDKLRKRGFNVSKASDLYVYFLLASDAWLADGGISAWLLPSEFLFTGYGSAVREYLSTQVELLNVHLYSGGSRFANARVSSCVIIFRKRVPRNDHVTLFTSGDSMTRPALTTSVRSSDLRRDEKWHTYFWKLKVRPEVSHPDQTRLGDLFRIRRGIATGANDEFLLTSAEVKELEIEREWIKPVIPRPRYLRSAIIEAADDGTPLIDDFLWMIDCDVPLNILEKQSYKFANYLREVRLKVGDRTLLRRRKVFYKQEGALPAPYLFTYMARDALVPWPIFLE
ncbi:MAG: N-6 DNA methylase [Gordonia paraffinivorans]